MPTGSLTRWQRVGAAAASGAALLLVLLTGVLHSPFLLLLPLPLVVLCISLSEQHAYRMLAGLALALLGAQALLGEIDKYGVAAVLVAPVLVAAAAGASRKFLRRQMLLEPSAAILPGAAAAPGQRESLEELQRQLQAACMRAGASAVQVWECTPQRLRAIAAAGRLVAPPLPATGDPINWVAREGTSLWLERTPYWTPVGNRVAAVRIWSAEDVAWVLTWEFDRERQQPSLSELEAFSGPLRILLGVLGAQQEGAAGHRRLQALLALLRRIPVEIELAGFGQELLQAALGLTGATGGCVGTWTGEAGEILAIAGRDGGPRFGATFTAPESELALAIRAGAPLVREEGRWRPGATQVAATGDVWHARPLALVSMPLATPTGVVGALALWSTRESSLDPRALELLNAVLPYAALHLDHARAFGRLQERAERDALTGLRNRRAFEAAFLAEHLRFERYERPLALLMIDIDHFKTINDQHGHQTGDEVLRALARVLESAIRDVDIPARFGGEEFVVLLPETSFRAALEVGERVRAAVERTTVVAGDRTLSLRVSVGVSACPEAVPTPAVLLGSADAALYEAKRLGRNQVQPPTPATEIKRSL